MDKIIVWLLKPLGVLIVSAIMVLSILYGNYKYNSAKLVKMEIQQEAQEQNEILELKYDEVQNEILDRRVDMIKYPEKAKENVDEEFINESNKSKKSYWITADDANNSNGMQ